MRASQDDTSNSFLRALSPQDFALLSAHLDRVDLPRRMVLVEENRLIQYVYYPEAGLASIAALQPDREIIEVGMFGLEGSSNFVMSPGCDRVPLRTFMQIQGVGWRMEAAAFAGAMQASASFMAAVMRYEQYKAAQFAYTALSHGSYTVPERLARWILMCQDRVGSHINITHDYLAMMLAVRRAGVTEGIQKLEGERFIKASRAALQVKDRAGLLAYASGGYGVPESEYERLIAPFPRVAS